MQKTKIPAEFLLSRSNSTSELFIFGSQHSVQRKEDAASIKHHFDILLIAFYFPLVFSLKRKKWSFFLEKIFLYILRELVNIINGKYLGSTSVLHFRFFFRRVALMYSYFRSRKLIRSPRTRIFCPFFLIFALPANGRNIRARVLT